MAKRWKVQYRQGFAAFNNVDSKNHLKNKILLYIYTIMYYIYIFICIIIRDNVAYEGFRVLDYL